MQSQPDGAEDTHSQAGTTTRSAPTADAAGEAIVSHITRRYSSAPGVIPLGVTMHMAERVARLAMDRLPLLELIRRRWQPAVSGLPDAWPQMSYLRWRAGAMSPAGPVGMPDAGPAFGASRSRKDPLPVVSAMPLSHAGSHADASGQPTPALPANDAKRLSATGVVHRLAPAASDATPLLSAAAPPLQPSSTPSAAETASLHDKAIITTNSDVQRFVKPSWAAPAEQDVVDPTPVVVATIQPAAASEQSSTAINSNALGAGGVVASSTTLRSVPVVHDASPMASSVQRRPESPGEATTATVSGGRSLSEQRASPTASPVRSAPPSASGQPGVVVLSGEPIVQRPRGGRSSPQPIAKPNQADAGPGRLEGLGRSSDETLLATVAFPSTDKASPMPPVARRMVTGMAAQSPQLPVGKRAQHAVTQQENGPGQVKAVQPTISARPLQTDARGAANLWRRSADRLQQEIGNGLGASPGRLVRPTLALDSSTAVTVSRNLIRPAGRLVQEPPAVAAEPLDAGDGPTVASLPQALPALRRDAAQPGSGEHTGVRMSPGQAGFAGFPPPVYIQRQASTPPPSPASPPSTAETAPSPPEAAAARAGQVRFEDIDLERVARAVYDLLQRRLQAEREARGL